MDVKRHCQYCYHCERHLQSTTNGKRAIIRKDNTHSSYCLHFTILLVIFPEVFTKLNLHTAIQILQHWSWSAPKTPLSTCYDWEGDPCWNTHSNIINYETMNSGVWHTKIASDMNKELVLMWSQRTLISFYRTFIIILPYHHECKGAFQPGRKKKVYLVTITYEKEWLQRSTITLLTPFFISSSVVTPKTIHTITFIQSFQIMWSWKNRLLQQ